MHKEPRASSGKVCVVHVNVGPEKEGGARSLVNNVLPKIDGGYHWVIDNKESIRVAADNELVYGAKGGTANAVGLHYCIIGQATQTAAEWDDPYSQDAITRCAAQVGADCRAKNINPSRTPGVFDGVCGHVDVTIFFRVVGGHTDPGPAFPWPHFIDLVRKYANLNVSVPTTVWPFGADMPQPSDVVDVLINSEGKWRLTADGGVQTVRGPFHGSYPGLPAAARQGVRYFTAIRANEGRAGYTLFANDGGEYSFPV